jgi:pimeloyl-ACP methyl ester carboxylesterase
VVDLFGKAPYPRLKGCPPSEFEAPCARGVSLYRIVDDSVELLDKVGRAVVLVHSLSGVPGWKLCETVPNSVARTVAIAPAPPANISGGYASELRTRFILTSPAQTISLWTSHSGIGAMPRGKRLRMRLSSR